MTFMLLSRKNNLFSKRTIGYRVLNLSNTIKIGWQKIGRGSYSQMRPNQQDWIRQKGLYLEEKGEPTFRQNYHFYSQAWRREQSYHMRQNGVGVLTKAQGIIYIEQYCDILNGGVVESLGKLEMLMVKRIFWQENDPKHTYRRAAKWFQGNNIDVMTWPAQFIDINPIKHL